MRKQFLREHHARQERVGKGDYREGFLQELPLSVIRSPAPWNDLQFATIVHVKSLRFCSGKLVFRFIWSVDEFARINALKDPEIAQRSFKRLKQRARADLRALSDAISDGIPIEGRNIAGTEYAVRWKIPQLKCDALKRMGCRAWQIGWRKDSEATEAAIWMLAGNLPALRWEFFWNYNS